MKSIFAKTLIASSLAFVAGAAAAADKGFYAGASYRDLDVVPIESGVKGPNISVSTLSALAGYRVNQYVAVEGSVGSGVRDGDVDFDGTPGKLKVDSLVTANVLANYPLGNGFGVYGTFGYTTMSVDLSAAGFTARERVNGFNYGAGVQYNVGAYTVRGGYENLYDRDDAKIDGVKVAVIYKF